MYVFGTNSTGDEDPKDTSLQYNFAFSIIVIPYLRLTVPFVIWGGSKLQFCMLQLLLLRNNIG